MEYEVKIKNQQPIENRTGLFIGTGVVAALLASLCCIGPLFLTILGVSGAAAFAKFDVIRGPLIFLVIGIFSFAGHTLYKKRKVCEPGSICSDPKKYRKMLVAYWVGLVIAIVGLVSPYIVAWIF